MDLRKSKIVATLVFPIKGDEVLLAKKTRKIGIGLWNGWGGGQEKDETIKEAALREFQDESGLEADLEDLEYKGKITFHNQKSNGKKFDVEVHMFLLHKWSGTLKSNQEMVQPTFWPIANLPFGGMMPSDKDWLPLILSGKFIEGQVWHGFDQKKIIRSSEIKRVA